MEWLTLYWLFGTQQACVVGLGADPSLSSLGGSADAGLAVVTADAVGNRKDLTMAKPYKLTDTHLMLLSAASQREDRFLTCPETLTGKAAKAAASKLLSGGLVEEVAVGGGDPTWYQDNEGQPIGLKITLAGLEAIGVCEEQSADAGAALQRDAASVNPPAQDRQAASSSLRHRREGTKRALVVGLLSRDQGATLDDLTTATGWLPHTTRAALTGLRQSGYQITRTRGEDNKTVYRIAAADESAVAQSTPEQAEV